MATFSFDLGLDVVPFQFQMHISVKVHCGKTADKILLFQISHVV